MSSIDILFQYNSTSTNSTITTGDLVYTANRSGQTLITVLYAAPSGGGTSNVWRLHHCGPSESPSATNCIIYQTATIKGDSYRKQRIVMRQGDRLFAALHSGTAVTVVGYGIEPLEVRSEIAQMVTANSSGLSAEPIRQKAQVESFNSIRKNDTYGF